jgi:ATP-dependent DNA ligase
MGWISLPGVSRCNQVELQSKSGQPLSRYFPEIVEGLRALKPSRFALDGELVIPANGALSFDDLLQRLHPARKPRAQTGRANSRAALPYQSGERTGMQKIKAFRTAECVSGGFRYAEKKPVAVLLMVLGPLRGKRMFND